MSLLDKILNKTASKLRFPWLALATAGLFVANVFIPDAIPMVDEILLGLATLLLARIRKPESRPATGSKATSSKTSSEDKTD